MIEVNTTLMTLTPGQQSIQPSFMLVHLEVLKKRGIHYLRSHNYHTDLAVTGKPFADYAKTVKLVFRLALGLQYGWHSAFLPHADEITVKCFSKVHNDVAIFPLA